MRMINLGNFEGTDEVIQYYIEGGKYGPYLKYKEKNYSIPCFYGKEAIDLKAAMKIIKNRDEWLAKRAAEASA